MAKHDSSRKIDAPDLTEYLASESGFAFELRCLQQLHSLGYQCHHGGSYTDPATRKIRQFDIRARKVVGPLRIHCAVECKHISESFPLLVTCVPRRPEESFHEILFTQDRTQRRSGFGIDVMQHPATTAVRMKSPHSAYEAGRWVGKKAVQVGRTKDKIYGTDESAFDKWSQALASISDMASDAVDEAEGVGPAAATIILPILVVPDGRLWQAFYDECGRQQESPFWSERCSLYVDRGYSTGLMRSTNFRVSHLEVVTLSGLTSLLCEVEQSDGVWLPLSKLAKPCADDVSGGA